MVYFPFPGAILSGKMVSYNVPVNERTSRFLKKGWAGMQENIYVFHKEEDSSASGSLHVPEDLFSITSLRFDHCGVEQCFPGHSFGPNTRTEFVIHFVLDGMGTLTNPKGCFEVQKNQMFILFPGETHLYTADKLNPWHYCWIGFRGDKADQLMRAIGFSEQTPVLPVKNISLIHKEIQAILSLQNSRPEDYFRRTSHTYNIFALLLENSEDPVVDNLTEESRDFSYATYAIRYIQRHFNEKLTIAELADHIGISRSYLTQLVKEQIGMSPQEYLISFRLEHAAHYLRNSTDPVRYIAQECGYEDSMAFSKAFRKKYGKSPSEYRDAWAGMKEGEDIFKEK